MDDLMAAITGFIAFFVAPLADFSPYPFFMTLAQVVAALDVSALVFVAVLIGRFQLPILAMWLVHVFRPSVWGGHGTTRIGTNGEKNPPLISVLIAGRNEEASIQSTIRSALFSGYENVEVIFVDDASSDATVARAREMARQGRVTVFAAREHNGKPTCLNIGLSMASGALVMIVDADSEVRKGSLHVMAREFRDARVGAVAANIRVRNARRNLVSRIQDAEYALNVSMSRAWRAALGVLAIVPGAAGMFRASAIKQMGGFDTGLGDDTDMTLRLRKAGWHCKYRMDAVVWTDVPVSWGHLFRQRRRWERNMVKIRIRKHGDMLYFWRYGVRNMLMLADNLLFRIVAPGLSVLVLIYTLLSVDLDAPVLLTHLYWFSALMTLLKLMCAKDICGAPRFLNLLLFPLMPVYRIIVGLVIYSGIVQEFLRINLKHGYVPDKIWRQTPHW